MDISNNPTALALGFDAAPGTDSFNGPDGVIDAAALGLLGGALEAVNDFYVSSSFQIQGLDPTYTYTLTFFGSHKFSTDDSTVYSVYSDSGYSNEVASVSLKVQTPGSPWLHNSNTVAVITNLVPQSGNILYVSFQGSGGNEGYLNAMRIDVHYPIPPAGEVDIADIDQSNGDLSVAFVGVDGVAYTLQYTTDLREPGSWQDVTVGGVPVFATGDGVSTLLLTDVDPPEPSRLYRLVPSP